LATSSIYSKIISTPFPSASELIGLDDNYIGKWLASIPDFFSEAAIQDSKFILSRSILSWRYRNFHILMYRPFVIQRVILESGGSSTVENAAGNESHEHSMADMAVQRCSSAAAETIRQITTFWSYQERRNMLACWYAMYFLFQAVLIPVICLRNDPQADAASGWRDQIGMSISTLGDMVPLSAAAEKCLSIICTLCGELLLRDHALQFQVPTDESPQTQLDNLSWLWAPISAEHFAGEDASL
jgi:transcriptional regulatory protein GAL4